MFTVIGIDIQIDLILKVFLSEWGASPVSQGTLLLQDLLQTTQPNLAPVNGQS